MTKLTYTKVSPTFHVYPDRNKKELIQITCASLDDCLDTVKGQKYYPAVIKDPNNKKENFKRALFLKACGVDLKSLVTF